MKRRLREARLGHVASALATVGLSSVAVLIGAPSVQAATLAASPPGCSDWVVTSAWRATQSNGYHPTFDLTQRGSSITGKVVLNAADTLRANFPGPVGKNTEGDLFGSIDAGSLSFRVTWPLLGDDQVVFSYYAFSVGHDSLSGRITKGQLGGAGTSVDATGVSSCYASDAAAATAATALLPHPRSSDTATIAGVAIGAVVVVGGAGWFVLRRRRRRGLLPDWDSVVAKAGSSQSAPTDQESP